MDESKGLKTFKEDMEIELKGLIASNKLLMDYQRQSRKDKKRLCNIIVILIICMFLEALGGFAIFAWYESQFEYANGEVVTETKTEDYETKGKNANINKVDGNQYNDNATHNEK